MAGTLTKEDFTELEKRFVTTGRFEAVIQALTARIEESEHNVTAAIDRAMREVASRGELENLKARVDRLEQKVG